MVELGNSLSNAAMRVHVLEDKERAVCFIRRQGWKGVWHCVHERAIEERYQDREDCIHISL